MNELCPGNCIECPTFIQVQAAVTNIDARKGEITRGALSEAVDEIFAPELLDLLKDGEMVKPDALIGIDSKEALAARIRADNDASRDELDNKRSKIIAVINELVRPCHGPLKMHAEKAGSMVTATICNNPGLEGVSRMEEVIVRRQSKRFPR